MQTERPSTIIVVGEPEAAPPVRHGIGKLTAALRERGWRVPVTTQRLEGDLLERSVRAGFSSPSGPEALGFCPLPPAGGDPPVVLIAGGDERGLMYALLEAARRIELSPATAGNPQPLPELFPQTTETPERAVRSVCILPTDAEVDREWFRSLDFWEWYFDLLALHRFNHFSLVFGLQESYLTPPYPYFVEVPEHPEVSVPSLSAAERESNLTLLRGITRLAVERAIDVSLGIWSQHSYRDSDPKVVGLTQSNLAAFCAAGIRRLLEACPDISGVQLRVNRESGLPLDEGAEFWRTFLAGVKACGRPIRLDLRAKAITDDTIASGLATGLPVTVSTKFWTEHLGLPYSATLLQEGDRYVRRHSYGDLLRYPNGAGREYAFQFRLWNVGTNKLLLWGDPAWVRQFAASTTLSGARGFEIFAPLSNKGYGGSAGGAWRIFDDPTYEHYRWEQQRYWYWYTLFGRLGYSAAADPEMWRREWAARFGEESAPLVEDTLREASRFLPLITAAHSPSASVFTYWPEKDMGGLLDLYIEVEPSDVAMFSSVKDAVANRVRGVTDARRTPAQVSAELSQIANASVAALEKALEAARPSDESAARELRGIALDVRVHAQLARYHAAKLRAAEHLACFYASGDLDSLEAAHPAAVEALAAWQRLVELTDGVYHHDLVFGRLDEQSGHWKDHLAYAQHDVERIEEVQETFRRFGLFDYAFDFGGKGVVGFTAVSANVQYTPERTTEGRMRPEGVRGWWTGGWGWADPRATTAIEPPRFPGGIMRAATAAPPDLPRDMLHRSFATRHPKGPYDNATFIIDLPEGEYEVTVVLADRTAAPRDHGPMTVILQGREAIGPVSVPAGEIVDLRRRVAVSSGRLEVELKAPPDGDWILTALVVTRVAPHIGHLPPVCLRPGEPFDVRVTVFSPEPVRRVSVRYRFDPTAAFEDAPLRSAVPHYAGVIDLPAGATRLEYYVEAQDGCDTVVTWPSGGAAAPRALRIGSATAPPRFAHEPVTYASPGQPLDLVARVSAGAPLERVTLHYRNVNQMQVHSRIEMQSVGDGSYAASIPAAHVTPEWDLMYHLEAVDVLGNAAFFPGLDAGTPYVVTTVAR